MKAAILFTDDYNEDIFLSEKNAEWLHFKNRKQQLKLLQSVQKIA